jgi:hypothetical protein
MRNIENSKVLKEPKLDVIQSKDDKGQRISTFTLHFNQVIPTTEEGDGS